MSSILICRSCGSRASAELAVNQQELAGVGMLELKCHRCGILTRWGMAQDFRSGERRRAERRRSERRIGRTLQEGGIESRSGHERRRGPIRRGQRRSASA